MSLLTICQAVCNVIPVTPPSTIVGNSDQTAILLLALANEAGNSLARRPSGGWVSMIREYDFVTAAYPTTGVPTAGTVANSGSGGVAVITGLASTASLAANTWYVSGTGLQNNSIIASVDSATQVTLTLPAATVGTGTYIFGKSDYALPSDFERPVDNTFWDRTRFWSMRGPQSPQQWQLYKSSVIGRASIQRRYRFRNISGNNVLSIDPTPFDNGSNLVFEYVSTGWCKNAGGTVYYSAWAADSNLGVVDEYLLTLGLKWRALRRLGMSYQEELSEYEREVSKAMAQDGGGAILDLTPGDNLTLIGPWNLPETNFGNVYN